jgi:hypothetical protein
MAADREALGGKRARTQALAAVAVVAAVVALVLYGRSSPDGPFERSFALSPQECNTQCQTRQTDCIEACDGHVPCERRCVEACQACVQRCLHPPDAGAGGAGGAGGRGGAAGRAGAGGRGRR